MSTKNQLKKPGTDPVVIKAPVADSGQAPAETKTPAATKVHALKIVSERDGFRRAGMAFGKQPSIIKRSDLSAAQIEQLNAEPLLTVTAVEIEDKAAAE